MSVLKGDSEETVEELKEKISLRDAYSQLYAVVKLPAMRTFTLVLVACRLGMLPAEQVALNVTKFKSPKPLPLSLSQPAKGDSTGKTGCANRKRNSVGFCNIWFIYQCDCIHGRKFKGFFGFTLQNMRKGHCTNLSNNALHHLMRSHPCMM